MPRAFTEEEKQKLRASLIKAGRKCFVKYGMKKTTVDDLAKTAGVARGSFYQFFKSKEALFLELFLQEIPALMTRLHNASFGTAGTTRDALVLLMRAMVHELETNEFARIILDDPEELEHFLSGLEYEAVLKHAAVAYSRIFEEVQRAQSEGEIISGDPQEVAFCLGTVKFLAVYREKMAPQLYESMIRLLPEVIADGLTCPQRQGRSNPKD